MSSSTFETISTNLMNDLQVARADIRPDRPLSNSAWTRWR